MDSIDAVYLAGRRIRVLQTYGENQVHGDIDQAPNEQSRDCRSFITESRALAARRWHKYAVQGRK